MPGNKKRDKEQKAQARREKKEKRNMHIRNEEEHDDCNELNDQLLSLGLSLKIIPGDGNCLFRALGDQLDGNPYEHLRHREDVVKYMLDHREDFEPFVEDDLSFDEHIRNLSELGTFGGNDSIVAFARLHDLTVVIHQLNKPLWQVYSEGGNRNKELHISYHNGDHYNSVRRSGDVQGTGPALVNLSRLQPSSSTAPGRTHDKYRYSDQSSDESDYENSPNSRKLDQLVEEVTRLTGVRNDSVVVKALETHGYDPNLAAKSLKSTNRNNRNVDLWSQNGTGSRIIGNQVLNSNEAGPSSRRTKMTAKQKKEQKKLQKKVQKNSGKKAASNDDVDENFQSSVQQLKTLTI